MDFKRIFNQFFYFPHSMSKLNRLINSVRNKSFFYENTSEIIWAEFAPNFIKK